MKGYRFRLAATLALAGLAACGGGEQPQGRIEGERRPEAVVARAQAEQDAAQVEIGRKAGEAPSPPERQILFGDLHVHTTYSIDAFMLSLPALAGEGVHPPADACDFARYCSAIDFFALTDHAESITPAHWQASKDSIRQCNALAGDPANPDLVAFMGFEWTQVGRKREDHFGHKCVFFPGTGDAELPARAITAQPDAVDQNLFTGLERVRGLRWVDPLHWSSYDEFGWMVGELAKLPRCPKGVDTRELPLDCVENAATPDVLFEKLGQWGFPVQVIPHGTTWGFYTPLGTSMDKQLSLKYHDPSLQRIIEIASGHGNAEQYRNWRDVIVNADGSLTCPEPTEDYLPCCWRAGEIMRERCGDLPPEECEARVAEAREYYMSGSVLGHMVFPDTRAEDWLDCGQCRDCFKPTLALRPLESVQYTLALSNPEEKGPDGRPLRFRYGFVASSDNHKARPGTGYKQYARREMTEAGGARSEFIDRTVRSTQRSALGLDDVDPREPFNVVEGLQGIIGLDAERVTSFLYPGGLAAVHSTGRSRAAIWEAMQRREVYGTSGPRILLWFDLVNGPEGTYPMGSEVALARAPQFRVKAVGSFKQKPGCPEVSTRGLSSARLEKLCRGECYNPSDERHAIVAVEVIRIRPQQARGEAVGPLIEDPWRRFDCPPDPAGCVVSFEDEEFETSGRDTVYYVRALQEPTPAVNGANLRTTFDAEGNAIATKPCYGDYRTPFDDDCLAPVNERAWSSPIYVDRPGA